MEKFGSLAARKKVVDLVFTASSAINGGVKSKEAPFVFLLAPKATLWSLITKVPSIVSMAGVGSMLKV